MNYFHLRSFVLILFTAWFLRVGAQPSPFDRPSLPEVGREMKEVEDRLTTGPVPRKETDTDAEEALSAEDIPSESPDNFSDSTTEPTEGQFVRQVSFRGDGDWLATTGIDNVLRALLEGEPVDDMERIREIVSQQRQRLVERQYYLANVWVWDFDDETETLILNVDAGRIGSIQYTFENERPHFTEAQLRRRLGDLNPGEIFDYGQLYRYVYGVNSHPDLIMDTFFDVKSSVEEGVLRREIDTSFVVQDSLPVHGVFYLNNYGTEATDNWQVGATLQHLNLTKNDDVLTIDVPVALDLGTLVSLGVSYSIPYYKGNGGRFTTYGGYSTLDTPNVVQDIDVNGEGYFGGAQWSHTLLQTQDHLVSGSLGVVHRYIEDQLVVQTIETEPRSANVTPVSAAVSYTRSTPDMFGGRNMATLQYLSNFGDFLGASDDEEIKTLRPAAESDYMIGRLQLARIQPIFGKQQPDGSLQNQWVLFAKAEGQVADGPLIPAEQIGIGGARSVRGYVERELFGDDGGYVNLELRTPMVFGLITEAFGLSMPDDSDFPMDRLQGVLFMDGGYTRIQSPLPSEDSSESIYSAGLGFRLALSNHVQFRFDWGFPLNETLESDSGGAGHLELQIQF